MRQNRGRLLALTVAAVVSSAPPAWVTHARAFVTRAQASVADVIAGPQFGDATTSLESYRRLAGTYDGSAVEGRGIVVRWATDRAYCLEGVTPSGVTEYLVGPGGHVSAGRCPYAY